MGAPERAPAAGPGFTPVEVDAGFTLVEVAVGIVVLIFGLLGLAYAMVSAYKLEQASQEKKLAVSFASSQLERIRSLSMSTLIGDPPTGYVIDSAWTTDPGDVGTSEDLDADGDIDTFTRYFYADKNKADYEDDPDAPTVTVPLYDSLLLGLRPIVRTDAPVDRVAEVTFKDPDGTTGVSEGDGYWVTVTVKYLGATGPSEVRIATFVTQK